MSKKRKSFKKNRRRKKLNNTRTPVRHSRDFPTENSIISALFTAQTPLSLTELSTSPSLEGTSSKELLKSLEMLESDKIIARQGRRNFHLSPKAPLYTGTLSGNEKGFGFVETKKINKKGPTLDKDVFIPRNRMAGAHHGDTLLIRVQANRKNSKTEGTVVEILETASDQLLGIVSKRGRGILVHPDDIRFPFLVKIREHSGHDLKEGDVVKVSYERQNRPTKVVPGDVLEILGPLDKIDTQMRLVVEKYAIPNQFSTDTELQTEQLSESFDVSSERLDLRSTLHYTIDGETAKDFDDAICLEEIDTGIRLYISIADVSYFVPEGSAIDQDAYARGTSVYFPGRVIPMLPEKLSNNLCSLVPHKDRFCVSAILDFNQSGDLIKKQFRRSVITSKQRFTYSTVKKILIDQNESEIDAHKKFIKSLTLAKKLATILLDKRRASGSIEFNIAEPFFSLNENDEVMSIERVKRNFAHQLIEEFMLAANVAVAEYLNSQNIPTMYRVHEPPDPTKVENGLQFIKRLDLPLTPFEDTPAWFAKTLRTCSTSRFDYIVNNLLLRSMNQAQYTSKNVGHFGLAAPVYTHFTSPIRRYPDLLVHRQLLQKIEGNSDKQSQKPSNSSLAKQGVFLSGRERNAMQAERDMGERLKINYMKNQLGEEFEAIISGVHEKGVFIEIIDLCVSGLIPITTFEDDYYIFDEKNYRLFGEITAKTYQLGDLLTVQVTEVDVYRKKIYFQPVAKKSTNRE